MSVYGRNQHNIVGLPPLVAQSVNNLLEMKDTQVRSLGGEDPLEKEMATHSSILAWEIPWTEELGRLQSMGLQRVDVVIKTKCYHMFNA